MKYIKKFYESKEEDIVKMFNLIMYDIQIYKIPYSYYGNAATRPDFFIYVLDGSISEKDDFKFMQELYHHHKILKDIYNLEFFNINLSTDKEYGTIILYDYVMKNHKYNEKNYLSRIENFYFKSLPNDVNGRVFSDNPKAYSISKGINYSNGSSSNVALFDNIYK